MAELVRYDAMCRAIAEAHKVDEVKDIRDKALAIEIYSRQAKNTDAELKACEIRLRAERRAGQLLSEMEKAKGAQGNPGGQGAKVVRSPDGAAQTLRQTARALLRQNVESDNAEQHDMFPGLQKRYPTSRSDGGVDPEYVLLEFMTKEDVAYNVQRLRRESVAKRKHAEALEAWGEKRFREVA